MLNPLNHHTQENPLTNALIEKTNQKRAPEDKITETLHLLLRVIVNAQPLASLQACYLNAKDEKPKTFVECLKSGKVPEYAMIDGVKLPILGLMELLAASRLLADVDVFGKKAQNVGFVVETTDDGKPSALRAVKLNASETFSLGDSNMFIGSFYKYYSDPLRDKKDLQFARQKKIILWNNLSAHQQLSFLTALKRGYEALHETSLLDFMLYRNNAWSSLTPGTTLLTPKIIEDFKSACKEYRDWQLVDEVYGSLFTDESLAELQTQATQDNAPIPEAPFNPKAFNAASFTVAEALAEATKARATPQAKADEAEAEARKAKVQADKARAAAVAANKNALWAELDAQKAATRAQLAKAEAQKAEAEARKAEAVARKAEAEAERAEAEAKRAEAEAKRVEAEAEASSPSALAMR